MNRRLLGWCVVAAIPVAYGLMLALPERGPIALGIPTALGCGGSATPARTSGWTRLQPAQISPFDPGQDTVSVATDGFFVIDAEGNDLSAEGATSSLVAEVRDESGALVPGRTWLVKEIRPDSYRFAWEASDALPIGAKLTVTLSATPVSSESIAVGGQFPIRVVGEPTELTASTLALINWVPLFHGEGPYVTCRTTCGLVSVQEYFVAQIGTEALWKVPAISGSVAWDIRLEPTSSESDAVAPEAPSFYAGTAETELLLGWLRFPTKADRHCVKLIVADLRTDDEVATEVCEQTGLLDAPETDSALRACQEPPSEGAKEAWCRVTGGLMGVGGSGQCAEFLGAAGSAGMPDVAGTSTTDNGVAAATSRTSSGCHFGVAAGSSSSGAAVLALLALTRLRRQRSWRHGLHHPPRWRPYLR